MPSLTTFNCVGRSLVDQLSCCFQRRDMDGNPRQPSLVPPLLAIPALKPKKSRIRMDVVMLLQGKKKFCFSFSFLIHPILHPAWRNCIKVCFPHRRYMCIIWFNILIITFFVVLFSFSWVIGWLQVRESRENRPSSSRCASFTVPVILTRTNGVLSNSSIKTYSWLCRAWYEPWTCFTSLTETRLI